MVQFSLSVGEEIASVYFLLAYVMFCWQNTAFFRAPQKQIGRYYGSDAKP